ncbi:MAG: hypothetical protein HC799_11065 [Limnothrix sp. RL_2_0]|nr:hypothetical protein [Limnothrix sp. RL_2_0]
MILRIFKAIIFPELRAEFEQDFALIAVNLSLRQPGCVSCQVGKPIHPELSEYAMLTLWQDRASLVAFAGEDYELAAPPAGMGRFIHSCSVEHYLSTKPLLRRSP